MMTRDQWLRYGMPDGHDACGIGAIVDIRGRQSRAVVDDALKIVESWSTGRARTPWAGPATAWGSSPRSAMAFSGKRRQRPA